MAQRRLRDWLDEIGSFEHNIFNLGLHSVGRYCGFDTIIHTGGTALTFELRHTATGVAYKDGANNVIGPIGVCMSAQGVLIIEDSPILNLVIDTNAGNVETRYDLIYVAHNYSQVQGGTAATYAIKKGTIGSAVKPILTDPLKEVAIGIIEIPPGAIDIADCIYHKMKSPDSGDGEDARLDTPNVFKATQVQNLENIEYTTQSDSYTQGGNTAHLWMIPPTANVYKIYPTSAKTLDGLVVKDVPTQEGMRISIMINENVTVRENILFLGNAIAAKGYKSIRIHPGLGNVDVGNSGGASIFGVKPSSGEIWEMDFLFFEDKWTLMKIGGVGQKDPWKRGMIVPWYGDAAVNFDDTGLGINLCAGFLLMNGNGGFPDLRGHGLVMATDVPRAGRPDLSSEAAILDAGLDPADYIISSIGQFSGKKRYKLSQSQLPPVQLSVIDPGHFHFLFSNGEDGVLSQFLFPSVGHSTGGNLGYTIYGSNTAPTMGKGSTAVTGISVFTGGIGQDIDNIMPVFSVIFMVKL